MRVLIQRAIFSRAIHDSDSYPRKLISLACEAWLRCHSCSAGPRKDQLIVSGVSANSFFPESQAKAAARANLPERIDSTMYTVSG